MLNSVCYLTIVTKSYPRKLAFTYLSDLANEFSNQNRDITSPTLRPYAYQSFDTFITSTRRLYQDTRASQNLDKLNADLQDVTRIMTKNIEDLLYRGDSLDRMSELSGNLRDESRKYRKAARDINFWAMWKQYGPPSMVALLILILLYWRFIW
jgi:vesicle transport protein SEC22